MLTKPDPTKIVGTFLTLDVADFDVKPVASLGSAPQLQWLDVSLLVVDSSYQRHAVSRASKRNIKRIAEEFDWRKFTPVVVSPVIGGLYAIVDGQHRTMGAMLAGVTMVPCSIIQADAIGQAEAFAAINKQVTAVSPIQIYKAKVAAGDPDALRLKGLAEAAGVAVLTYNKSGNDVKPHETHAITAIQKSAFLHGDRVAALALRLLRIRASKSYRTLVAGNILATAAALKEFKGIDDVDRLEKVTKDVDYNELYQLALKYSVDDRSKTVLQHHAELIGIALCPSATETP